MVVGIMNKIEIWSRERWEAVDAATQDRMDEISDVLSEIGL